MSVLSASFEIYILYLMIKRVKAGYDISARLSLLNIKTSIRRSHVLWSPATSSIFLLFSTKTDRASSHVCAAGLFSKLWRVLWWLLSLSLRFNVVHLSVQNERPRFRYQPTRICSKSLLKRCGSWNMFWAVCLYSTRSSASLKYERTRWMSALPSFSLVSNAYASGRCLSRQFCTQHISRLFCSKIVTKTVCLWRPPLLRYPYL